MLAYCMWAAVLTCLYASLCICIFHKEHLPDPLYLCVHMRLCMRASACACIGAVSYALSSLQGEETHPGRSEYSG